MVVNESYIECTLYRTSKHMEQKLREMKREIDKSICTCKTPTLLCD